MRLIMRQQHELLQMDQLQMEAIPLSYIGTIRPIPL